MINNEIFHQEKPIAPIPRYNPDFEIKEKKSCFIDENRVTEESVKMGEFSYDSFREQLIKYKESKLSAVTV